MLMSGLFGEDLFDDFWGFPTSELANIDKQLYGKHAQNLMKTDVHENETDYENEYENEYEGHTLPTKSDVEKYVTRKRYSVDPTAFFKYYEAMGWRVNGKPVANWQALVDYWAHMDSGKSNSPNASSTAFLSKDEIKAILNNKNQ